MLAAKMSAGVTPEVNLKQCLTWKYPPSANKAAHSCFEAQMRHHQKSKTRVSVAIRKGLKSFKGFKKTKNLLYVVGHELVSQSPDSQKVRSFDERETKLLGPSFCWENNKNVTPRHLTKPNCTWYVSYRSTFPEWFINTIRRNCISFLEPNT